MTKKEQSDEQERQRIEFARHALDNVQSLIRFMDEKSGFALVILGLLSAALVSILGVYFDKCAPAGGERFVILAGVAVYLVLAVCVLSHSFQTIRARPNTLGNHCGTPGMLFPLIIKKEYDLSDERYLTKLSVLQPQEVLAEYAQQLMENSHIYATKCQHVNQTLYWLHWLAFPWAIVLATVLVHLLLKDHICGLTAPLSIVVAIVSLIVLGCTVGKPSSR